MSSVFYRDLGESYPVAVRGEGAYLFDKSGKTYLDMSGGAAVSCLGHGHPEVIEAIQRQASALAFAHTAFFSNEPQEELAERVANRFSEAGAKVWFTAGGSESNETALKIAWQYWQTENQPKKAIVISRQYSYHGGTLGACSVSGSRFRRAAFENVLHDWPRISPCYAYRFQETGESEEAYSLRAAAELDAAISGVGSDNVAAFIAEPVVGATLGAVPPTAGYLKEIRRICDAHNVLFIADEVMCGSGRCGSFFAHTNEECLPDIVTLAKGLGGGYQSLGAVIARRHVAAGIAAGRDGFAHGHTYIGHPIACAAGVAVQRCLDDGLLESVNAKGEMLREKLRATFAEHRHVGDIRGRGLFSGMEFVADKATKQPFPSELKIPGRMKKSLMEHGLICYPGGGSVDGRAGAHLLIAPPFIATEAHFDEFADGLARVFGDVLPA